jgi:hypothetical protein
LITSTKAASGRVGLKLAVLFALVVVGIIGFFLVKDLLAAFSVRSELAVRPEEVTVIDPKLEANLKKVMEQQELPQSSDLKDPFRDRADLSGEMAKQGGGSASQEPTLGRPGEESKPGSGQQGTETKTEAPDPVAETKARFEQREERLRMGLNVPAESEVFAVDDLIPVGSVSGGSGRQEVLFFSRALKRNLSFQLGAKLFDGWIAEVRPEGVAFVLEGRVKTTRVKLWSSSTKDVSRLPSRWGTEVA